jgi:hypothetical protein
VRDAVAAEGEASAGAMGVVDLKRGSVRPPQSQRAAIAASVERHARGEAARQALFPVYPILADLELRTEALAAATPATLGSLLVADAAARLADIEAPRANVASDWELPCAWPRITGLTLEAMGLEPDSVHGRLVAAQRARLERRQRDVRAGLAAFARRPDPRRAGRGPDRQGDEGRLPLPPHQGGPGAELRGLRGRDAQETGPASTGRIPRAWTTSARRTSARRST